MTPNSSGPGRTRLLGIALLLATFLAGGFSGAALERRSSPLPPAPAPEAEAQPDKQEADKPRGHRGMLLDQIGLTTEQRAAIDSILQDGREKIDAYWKETEPGYRALVDTTRAHVRAVLTPDQLSEYDRLRAEHRARARAREEGGAERANQNGGKSISSGYGGGVNGWSSINSKRHAEAKETRSE